MYILVHRKKLIFIASKLIIMLILIAGCFIFFGQSKSVSVEEKLQKDLIKWVDLKFTYEALDYAVKLDIKHHDSNTPMSFINILAYISAKNGNNFRNFKTRQIDDVAEQLKAGKTMDELSANLKYYNYYKETYTAALSGLVGDYEIEVEDETSSTGKKWERKYGIKAFLPIAKGFYYTDYDDFCVNRSYGFSRKHLGHDMMGYIGTPIIAVEGGKIEELGWNQYGGWRIGIRSHDSKRYYYYAHMRKGFPYNKSLKVGSVVKAGDVIGYMGRTGYSRKENVNNMTETHLHIGLQLVFDESQKECDNEIWVDTYPIMQLLYRNKSKVVKNNETKEYSRVYNIREIAEE